MIDLHSHILHDIDDGATSLDMSLEMARVAVNDGITTIAATPHGFSGTPVSRRYSVPRLRERLDELRTALERERLPLEVVPGTELLSDASLPERLKAGELLPYGDSRTVLLEFPNHATPATLEQGIFMLQVAGYRVLLAHPERLRVVQDDPNALISLIERGVFTQLTAEALTGKQGRKLQELSETLVRHALIHVMASDAHGPHVDRMPLLSAARRRAAELIGEAAASALVQHTPAALLSDGPVDVASPQLVQKRRWFW